MGACLTAPKTSDEAVSSKASQENASNMDAAAEGGFNKIGSSARNKGAQVRILLLGKEHHYRKLVL